MDVATRAILFFTEFTTVEPKLFPRWQDQVTFSPEGPRPNALFEAGPFKAVMAGLEPGQSIPLHPEGAAVYHFLEGTGWMLVNDERLPIQPGATIVMPAGTRRGVQAETRLAFLAARVA
jgi:quercetin dioxygenase-like cupin family protein